MDFPNHRWEVLTNQKGRMNMSKKMIVFCGSDTPDKAFPPFMLGAGGLALEMEVTLFFTMNGLNIIKKGGAERIVFPGAPKTLPEFIKLLQDGGVRMIACSTAMPLVGCTEKDLIDGIECAGVATFVSAAAEADVVLTF
jgi:predicted peroxiredoxin